MNEEQPISAERLMNTYAQGLRRYLVAERALAEASEPISPELVYAHHLAAEDFRVIRGVLQASLRSSEALRAIEDRPA